MSEISPAELRMIEALLFAAEEPLDEATLVARLPEGTEVPALLARLQAEYEGRGVNLAHVAGKWCFRTAADLRYLLELHRREPRRLSRAALETLAIIAYHQPITRAEVEEVRGVGLSKGTLDILMEIGWVRPRGRKRVPGRPITYGTTDSFLGHFDLEDLQSLPGLAELKAAGLLDATPPPFPISTAEGDEEPLEETDEEASAAVPPTPGDEGRAPHGVEAP
jgi:segregation and condensation protein B